MIALGFSSLTLGSAVPQQPTQTTANPQVSNQQMAATGFKDAKVDECITVVLSPNQTLRRKNEALSRIIEIAQKNGSLDMTQLYRFASLSDITKSYVL